MIKVITYIAVFIVLVFGYVKYIEMRGVFFPYKEIEYTPAVLHIPFEEIYLTTQDKVELNGWFIPKKDAEYTLFFCHGNAGNIGHRLEKIVLLRQANINIFIIDYRGYGRSKGRPSEEGLYLDAKAGYDYLVRTRAIEPQNIILYGESIGAAVVIDLASKEKVGAFIAEGAFSNGRDIAKRLYPFLPAFLFSYKFDSLVKVKTSTVPKLFIHSKDDEIAPFDLAQKLYNAAQAPKKMTQIIGGHNTAFLDSQEAYIGSVKSFLEEIKDGYAEK